MSAQGFHTRHLAFRGLKAIFHEKKTLDQAFSQIFSDAKMDSRDQAFVRSLIYETLRFKGYLDFFLKRLMRQPLKAEADDARLILWLGLAQIYCMDVPDHAAIDIAVDMVKGHKSPKVNHLSGLVNGVLRNGVRQRPKLWRDAKRDPLKLLPRWLINRWERQWGLKTARSMAKALAFQPPIDISLRPDRPINSRLKNLAKIEIIEQSLRFSSDVSVPELPGFDDGDWWVQDVAATLPVRLLGDVTGQRVLDVCAAPGGKTMQLATRGAKVTALDISSNRMKRLEENVARVGIADQVTVTVADALTHKAEAPYDAILLDAPCSATGTFRRHPDGLWIKSGQTIAELVALQAEMMDHLWAELKVGGIMLYCVCSLEQEEGEQQAEAFLERHADATLSPIDHDFGGLIEGLPETIVALRTRPDMRAADGSMDGFYMVRLEKKPS